MAFDTRINTKSASCDVTVAVEISWTDEVNSDGMGTGGGVFTAAVRFLPEDLADYEGRALEKVAFRHYEDQPGTFYRVIVWTGGSNDGPGQEVYSQRFEGSAPDGWNEVALTTPILVDASQELWLGVEMDGRYPMSFSGTPGQRFDKYYAGMDNSWYKLQDLDFNWALNIKGILGPRADTAITTVPTAGDITYGQTLADSTLTGGGANVRGSFAWKDSTVAPAVSDSNTTEPELFTAAQSCTKI